MNIKIGKSARACVDCSESFVHEQELFSVIRVQDEEFIRQDYCTDCWTSDHASSSYSFWSPLFYDQSIADQAPPETFSPLRKIFYDSVDSDERCVLAMAYLAAQLLRRQKVFRLLKEVDDTDAETKFILFSDRIGNRLIEVRDPSLSFDELEEGRLMLMQQLADIESPPEATDEGVSSPKPEGLNDAPDQEEKE